MSSPIPLHARNLGLAALLAAALAAAPPAARRPARSRTRASPSEQHDYDRAVVEYTKALQENPDDRTLRLALDRGEAARVAGALPARAAAGGHREVRGGAGRAADRRAS